MAFSNILFTLSQCSKVTKQNFHGMMSGPRIIWCLLSLFYSLSLTAHIPNVPATFMFLTCSFQLHCFSLEYSSHTQFCPMPMNSFLHTSSHIVSFPWKKVLLTQQSHLDFLSGVIWEDMISCFAVFLHTKDPEPQQGWSADVTTSTGAQLCFMNK